MNIFYLFQGWSVMRAIALLVLLAAVITGCSEEIAGVGTGGTGSNQYAMGGAIQGKALALTNAVTTIVGTASTVAGTPGSADGVGAAARFNYPMGATTDGTYLYVADFSNYTIRKIVIATGAVSTLAGTAGVRGWADGVGTTANFYFPQGITTDGTNLYIADCYTIRKITIATGEVTTMAGYHPDSSLVAAVDGIGTAARFAFLTSITTDGTNLYVGDGYTIRKIDIATAEVTTLAGAAGMPGSYDGLGSAARFQYPSGITTDGTNLYVADRDSIRQIVIARGAVTTLVRFGPLPNYPDVAYVANGITTDGMNLYLTYLNSNIIKKVEIAAGRISELAGADAPGLVDGNGSAARFNYPSGITTDGTNLYVADTGNNSIRQIGIAAGTVITLAGPTVADGVGNVASFYSPKGIATDGENLYVSEPYHGVVRKIVTATGEVTTLDSGDAWGVTTYGSYLYFAGSTTVRKLDLASGAISILAGSPDYCGRTDGIGSEARFCFPGGWPSGITTDGVNLYVAGDGLVRKIVIATGMVTTVAGTDSSSGTVDCSKVVCFSPYVSDITTDGSTLYVADDNLLRKIEISTGVVTTLAGREGHHQSVDGIGAEAGFSRISGITTDGTNLYVTDSDNTIRKVVIASGEVTTIAGTSGVVGASDGVKGTAQFNLPQGITSDGSSLYVVDSGNNMIRKIQ